MSAGALRVAVVGAGLMGRWHAAAAARVGAQVVAVADPDHPRATRLARRHGARVVPLAGLLEDRSIQALHVCTPLETHAAIATAALDAGLPVLVEKPLAPNASTTEALLQLAARRQRPLCPVHQFPFQRGVQRVLAAVPRFGPVLHADYVACTAGAEGRDAAAGEAIVADILPHPLSLLRSVVPGALADLPWHVARPRAGELRATAAAAGITVSLLISLAGRPTRNSWRLVGTAGTAHVDLFHGFATFESGAVSRGRKIARPFARAVTTLGAAAGNLARRAVARETAYPGLQRLVEAFYAAVRGTAPSPIEAAEIRDVALARDRIAGATGA